jgi:hypothetical protein
MVPTMRLGVDHLWCVPPVDPRKGPATRECVSARKRRAAGRKCAPQATKAANEAGKTVRSALGSPWHGLCIAPDHHPTFFGGAIIMGNNIFYVIGVVVVVAAVASWLF